MSFRRTLILGLLLLGPCLGRAAKPVTAQEWVYQGWTLEKQGNYRGAAKSYRVAMARDQTLAMAWRSAGLCAYRMKDFSKAEKLLNRYLELAPQDTRTKAFQDKLVAYNSKLRNRDRTKDGRIYFELGGDWHMLGAADTASLYIGKRENATGGSAPSLGLGLGVRVWGPLYLEGRIAAGPSRIERSKYFYYGSPNGPTEEIRYAENLVELGLGGHHQTFKWIRLGGSVRMVFGTLFYSGRRETKPYWFEEIRPQSDSAMGFKALLQAEIPLTRSIAFGLDAGYLSLTHKLDNLGPGASMDQSGIFGGARLRLYAF